MSAPLDVAYLLMAQERAEYDMVHALAALRRRTDDSPDVRCLILLADLDATIDAFEAACRKATAVLLDRGGTPARRDETIAAYRTHARMLRETYAKYHPKERK